MEPSACGAQITPSSTVFTNGSCGQAGPPWTLLKVMWCTVVFAEGDEVHIDVQHLPTIR